MKLIDISTPSHANIFAMVDDEDFDNLNQWKWSAEKRKKTFYAIRGVSANGKQSTIRMHRQIAPASFDFEVDHADGNGLNNQRGNLRPCSVAQNQQNRNSETGSSKYKGVLWDKSHNCWQARVVVGGIRHGLGSFENEDAAARRYDQAAKAHFGEFARLNFPNEECCAAPANVKKRLKKILPKGVHQMPSGRFAATRRVGGKGYFIGVFDAARDAEKAYLEFCP